MTDKEAADKGRAMQEAVSAVVRGQTKAVRWLLAAFVSGGHVLLEDVPGTGKTTLAKTLARSVDCVFRRVQFTPDLLPSDILGVSIYDQASRTFRFHEGPVFTQVLLADEINRASPRTQSALLEAMAERQVTVEGRQCQLDPLFCVIATQNPVEHHGTYPLPEAQMDRFAMHFGLGYLPPAEECELLAAAGTTPDTRPVALGADLLAMRQLAAEVRVAPELRRYIVDLAAATRQAPGVRLGAGPRGTLSLLALARALALLDGAGFVTPDLVQELAAPVLAHRLLLDPEARFAGLSGRAVVEQALRGVPVPA